MWFSYFRRDGSIINEMDKDERVDFYIAFLSVAIGIPLALYISYKMYISIIKKMQYL